MLRFLTCFSIVLLTYLPVLAQHKNHFTPVSDKAFSIMGRAMCENNVATYNWPGVAVSCMFEGEKLGVRIKGGARDYFNVWVDEQPVWVIHPTLDSVYYFPRTLKEGWHQLTVVKRTEGDMGTASFYGIITEKGKRVQACPERNNRKIIVIGNSITCGYGTEGKSRNERFSPATENCEQSYAAILARAFKADYHLIAHSGLGVVRNYGDSLKISKKIEAMPARLEYFFDSDKMIKWNMNQFVPDVVLINLGTNDFSTLPHPDEIDFKAAYKKLIKRLNSFYPNVKVFCITGPMINEPCYNYVKAVAEEMNAKGFSTYFIGTPFHLLNDSDDLGSDWHPSFKGQLKTADYLVNIIANITQWDYEIKFLKLSDKYFNQ